MSLPGSLDAAAAPAHNSLTFGVAFCDYHQQRQAETASLAQQYSTLHIQPFNSRTLSLHTVLRDARTETAQFAFVADQLLRQLVDFALSTLRTRAVDVTTPTLTPFLGCELEEEVCAVSIVRAGEAMEAAIRSVMPGIKIGKILIQRDESKKDKPAQFFYAKLPPKIQSMRVLLLDPMLASGGSAICAVQHLLSIGVPLAQITFVNLISSPEGIHALYQADPSLSVVTGMLDRALDERKYILPGVGDMGDRYFGTVEPPTEPGTEELFKTTNATTAQ
jgi:uracil phosphoribosyltransferase